MQDNMPYLNAALVNPGSTLPLLCLDIENNTCRPYRNVFQVLHKHEEIEFILVLKHKLHVQTTMAEVTLYEGEGIFIPKHVLHVLNTFGDCVCKAFLFSDTLLTPLGHPSLYDDVLKWTADPLMPLVKLNKDSPSLDKLKNLNTQAQHENNAFALMTSIYDLWSTFTSHTEPGDYKVIAATKDEGDRLKQYLAYIHGHYATPIDLEGIAKAGFTSVSECNRRFKSTLNVTAYDYLIKYRINVSLDMLKEGRYTITEIAHKVGYNSPSQYTKYFKRHMHQTPRTYKKAWRHKSGGSF